MSQPRNPRWKPAIYLLVALWMTRTAGAQDYPQYAPAASTFVPLDSWVYPALERLAAFGYVTTAIEGMKPWTRTECARLTQEAGDAFQEAIREDRKLSEEAARLHEVLEREFAPEIEVINGGRNRSFRLESVYTRALSISGPPLTDGFHFGQTVAYDFGRPFRRGFNSVAGSAWRATAGPFAFYVRAEYQHAPSSPGLSDAVRNLISSVDQKPLPSGDPLRPISRLRLLDTYVSFHFRSWQFSFGRQSLSWGIGEVGSLLLSDNAEPLLMGRLSRVVPMRLPGFLSNAGPLRVEFFVGELRGGVVVPNPLLYGHQFSFKVSPHVEIGYGRTVILGSRGTTEGDPFTAGNLFRSFFGLRNFRSIPGDNRDALDVLFRMPRTALQLYGEFYADDKPLYWVTPRRGAYRVGFYAPELPRLTGLDLRVEVTSTDSFRSEDPTHTVNYWNFLYKDGYTNYGVLMGNTVGRQGMTYQVWSTYHFSPTHTLQFQFKHNWVNPAFIQGGGIWQDYSARHEIHLRSGFYVKSWLQYENIRSSPILFNGPRKNVAASVELGFMPEGRRP